MSQYITGVIAEKNILPPLCLDTITKTSPFNLTIGNGNGNRFFTQESNFQIANYPRLPQSQTDAQ